MKKKSLQSDQLFLLKLYSHLNVIKPCRPSKISNPILTHPQNNLTSKSLSCQKHFSPVSKKFKTNKNRLKPKYLFTSQGITDQETYEMKVIEQNKRSVNRFSQADESQSQSVDRIKHLTSKHARSLTANCSKKNSIKTEPNEKEDGRENRNRKIRVNSAHYTSRGRKLNWRSNDPRTFRNTSEWKSTIKSDDACEVNGWETKPQDEYLSHSKTSNEMFKDFQIKVYL